MRLGLFRFVLPSLLFTCPLRLVFKLPPDYMIHPLHPSLFFLPVHSIFSLSAVRDMSWISHYVFPADLWSLGFEGCGAVVQVRQGYQKNRPTCFLSVEEMDLGIAMWLSELLRALVFALMFCGKMNAEVPHVFHCLPPSQPLLHPLSILPRHLFPLFHQICFSSSLFPHHFSSYHMSNIETRNYYQIGP